jgi:uncharacterized membrane protein HdeD (DUF308 family)
MKRTKLYKHWYLLTFRGLLIILMGIFAFFEPREGSYTFARIFELFALISGLLMIQMALMNRTQINWQWTLTNGLMDFFVGIMLYILPNVTVSNIIIIIALWLLYTGILHFGEAFILIKDNIKNWWFELLSGILFGFMAIILMAAIASQAKEIFILLGVFASITGVFVVLSSFILKEPDRFPDDL